jgi:hypothetical protein
MGVRSYRSKDVLKRPAKPPQGLIYIRRMMPNCKEVKFVQEQFCETSRMLESVNNFTAKAVNMAATRTGENIN